MWARKGSILGLYGAGWRVAGGLQSGKKIERCQPPYRPVRNQLTNRKMAAATTIAAAKPINIEYIQSFFNCNGPVPWFVLFHGECILGIFKTFSEAYYYRVIRANNAKLEKDETIQLLSMNPFTWDYVNMNWEENNDKQKDINNMKELLNLPDRISVINAGKISGARLGAVELSFLYLMQNPEMIARHPQFREVAEKKSNELISEIMKNPEYPQSRIILDEYPRFLEAIKMRSDFVQDNTTPGWKTVLSYPGGFPVWKNTLTGEYVNEKPVVAKVTPVAAPVVTLTRRTYQPPQLLPRTHTYWLRSRSRS